MKIRKLEICGFKSFVDRTVLTFDQEITGVVGPNGCGKSNVVDAIRWVMGEQSAKNLRGKAMEDVIFNGCESRGPHGFAEVTLTFDNGDGLAPPEYRDYPEISVTRRLDRSGESDYFINRTPVRLMDVTNLFLGTGVGKRAYSIIEQGRIGLIVSAKPEDRRHLIEEAAGITKFKAKKKAAERRMEQTRQNLLRIADITAEIEKNLASLKRQAQKAERYKAYRAEVRDLELFVASHKWLEWTVTQRVVRSALDAASAVADGARAALRVREAEVETDRLRVAGVESRVEHAQTRSFELDNAVKLLETELEHAKEQLASLRAREDAASRETTELRTQQAELGAERDALELALRELEGVAATEGATLDRESAELETRRDATRSAERVVSDARARSAALDARIAAATATLTSFEARRRDATQRAERLRVERERLQARVGELTEQKAEQQARLDGLRTGRDATASRKEEVERELTQLRAEIKESDVVLDRLRGELSQRRSRLHSLEEIHKRHEGVGAGVRAVMGRKGLDAAEAIRGLVADRVECPAELSRALAGALGERLQYVVVESLDAAVGHAAFLAQGNRGRATLIPARPRRVVRPQALPPDAQGVVGMLADLVAFSDEDEWLVRHLLGDVVVVETLADAIALHRAGFAGTAVTRQGELVGAEGRLVGGSGDDVGAHMLDMKREIRSLHEVVARLDEEFTRATERHTELRKGIATRQASLDAARNEAHGAELGIVKAEQQIRHLADEATKTTARVENMSREANELSAQLARADEEESQTRVDLTDATKAKDLVSTELAEAVAAHEERRIAVEAQTTVVTEVRVRAAQARQKVEGDRAAADRLSRSIVELDARAERLRTEILECARRQGELAARLIVGREELYDRVEVAMQARTELATVRAEFDAMRHEMGAIEAQLREIRSTIDAATAETTELTLRERELGMNLERLLDQVAERHRVDLRKVLGDYHLRDIPDASVRDRIDELARLIERMGEINLMAIEEFEEQSKRYEYLAAQKLDLETALEQLDRAIRQMNRESRRRFRETFDAVNARFQSVFPKMFGGGKAELRLTDPEDMLETGIDIIAQPPGKKLGSIELMSGGEKALTAVSLIFAIFQCKPSPFCLLDEVDAPLDEANIGRFADAIRQMTAHSQFILITHSKRTMELADLLYGVTMETPGISKLVSVELTKRARSQRPAEGAGVAVA